MLVMYHKYTGQALPCFPLWVWFLNMSRCVAMNSCVNVTSRNNWKLNFLVWWQQVPWTLLSVFLKFLKINLISAFLSVCALTWIPFCNRFLTIAHVHCCVLCSLGVRRMCYGWFNCVIRVRYSVLLCLLISDSCSDCTKLTGLTFFSPMCWP